MDHLADFLNFKRMVMRLCTTFDKFATDELIETWWKVLKDENYKRLEARVDSFIAGADDKTRFPKPGKFLSAAYVNEADANSYNYAAEQSKKNWRQLIRDYPTTGPIRLKLAQASQILASSREDSPQYAEATAEYLALEKMLGANGRFSADV